MTKESFIIQDIIELKDGNLAIGLSAVRQDLAHAWAKKSIHHVKSLFVDKTARVVSISNEFSINIEEVDILNSIADYKNVFLKIRNTPKTREIQIKDKVEISL